MPVPTLMLGAIRKCWVTVVLAQCGHTGHMATQLALNAGSHTKAHPLHRPWDNRMKAGLRKTSSVLTLRSLQSMRRCRQERSQQVDTRQGNRSNDCSVLGSGMNVKQMAILLCRVKREVRDDIQAEMIQDLNVLGLKTYKLPELPGPWSWALDLWS